MRTPDRHATIGEHGQCKDSHPRALSRHTCLPHPPMRTPSVRAQSTPAQSMPAQMRCVWRSSSAAPDRCRRSRRPRGARIAHTPLEEQLRPAALYSTRSIEPTATSTSRPSLWRPVRLRDLVLVDVALAASPSGAAPCERSSKGCSVGHFDDAPRFRVTARVILYAD